jgi:outer membrane receptor protein involved in Fe transport
MSRSRNTFARLMCGAAVLALAGFAGAANAAEYDIAPQPLAMALKEFGMKTGQPVLYGPSLADAKMSSPVVHAPDAETALMAMLDGTGLTYRRNGDTFLIVSANDPQSGSAAGDGADGTVAALIVTAQKREENIQDVPIAISAFSEKSLQEQKIEGGFDLLKAIPNVTFSKNNFTSYNFSIRGIGTKAVSATTDPGVAVAFNNSGMIVNRLFEQEYVDVERVEVLRGPQGTLYGRNATSGVINVISAKPNLHEFDGWIKGEVGNYNAKRLSTVVNIPLIEDKLGIRFAGALTKRDGYGYNAVTKSDIDGRDLWTGRLTLGFEPIESLRANLIWERFNENDERARTSKQLCHTDPGLHEIGSVTGLNDMAAGILGQGCLPGSMYDDGAFGAPNGNSLPYIFALRKEGDRSTILAFTDPYNGIEQSHDLREISSRFDPIYRAKADVIELNIDYDLTPKLTVISQTLYDKDRIYSTQDYNRFNTRPVINPGGGGCVFWPDWDANGCPGGYFNDPQLGSSNTIVLQDISEGASEQFSQEFRLQSDFDGPVNFSVGANYVRFETNIHYYVLSNSFTMLSLQELNGATDTSINSTIESYIDPNPLDQITGAGQNYYHSQNPYRLKSTSAFGELYWGVRDDVKITAGLRYTDDRKKFEVWPTSLLNSEISPYHQEGEIKQHWGEWTGRLGIDWKPDLSFTDQTMIYAFYSRGYKAGGANPPNMDRINVPLNTFTLPVPANAIHPPTFEPEFVNAYEVGTKNVLMGGGLVFNATAFYYDYKDYQVSQIIDRIALNENFDAKIWGLEFEALWSPTHNLRFNANLGYLDSSVGKGEKSIDLMNRTAGHDDWTVLKNWIQYPSNCIVPKTFLEAVIPTWRELAPVINNIPPSDPFIDSTALMAFFDSPCQGMYSPTNTGGLLQFPYFYFLTGAAYDPYDPQGATQWGVENMADANYGAGFDTDLSGHELPNAPHWTMNLGAQYSHEILDGTWKLTVRGDAYWQSQSWARIYNLNPYDKLHGWYNANLSVWVENDKGLKIEGYVKNLLDKDAITDAFLNSDDSGLTTNVFTLDPRLIGVSITKDF